MFGLDRLHPHIPTQNSSKAIAKCMPSTQPKLVGHPKNRNFAHRALPKASHIYMYLLARIAPAGAWPARGCQKRSLAARKGRPCIDFRWRI